MKIRFKLFIFLALFSASGACAFADQPSSDLDDKPTVDQAASQVSVPAVPSDQTAADNAHTSYLYDLKKLIDKSRENIKEVNEKIKEQAILKRNQKREERAHEYYEKGVELTNEGKLDEAREYFEKAIRITEHPEMAGYIKQSQRRLQKQEDALHAQEREHYKQIKQDENTRKEDVEAAYREAVDLFKQKKYHPAKDAFEHVDEIAPDYRATDSYLKIIDQEIIKADALAVKQQAVEVARQQKEAEAARVKEKQMWLQQIEEKEKERKESVDKQAEQVYEEAVALYKNKKFAEAKKKFEEVSWVIPDYKATMKYLGRIDSDAERQKQIDAEAQEKALQEQRWEEEVESKKQAALRQSEMKIKDIQNEKDIQEQADFLYTGAVVLYKHKNMDEALEKFNEIEKLSPDFKSTRDYIVRIEQWDLSHNKPVPAAAQVPLPPAITGTSSPVPETMPPQVKVAVSLEDQQKQAQDIATLVERSAQLYRELAEMADDSSTNRMKRKMAQVEDMLKNLEESKESLLRRMRHELWETQQDDLRAKQDEHRAEAEKIYQEAQEFLRSHDFDKAKIKFLELENIIPDYKGTRRYLSRIEDYQKRSGVEAVTGYEKSQADHLREMQEKADAEEERRNQQEQEKQHNLREQEQAQLISLIQKASDINDDIIRYARQQNYDAMKVKFGELENVVTSFMTIKDSMIKQKDLEERQKESAREEARSRREMLRAQQQEDRQIHAYDEGSPLMENRPVLSNQPNDVDIYKRREIMKEQNDLFSEGVDRYEHRKYTQARLLFGELADQHDHRAEVWLKKVDAAITRELLRSKEGEEKEQTAFIADQVKAQRQLILIQERERQRQKKLTEEMERQKRLYEDDRLLQLRKEEILKSQEREREIQEAKRVKLEKENEQKSEMLRFHKIVPPPPKPVQPVPPAVTAAPVVPKPAPVVKPVVQQGLTNEQLQAQIDFSNKRKKFLDAEYLREEKERERQAEIKARADARQKRIEEREQEREHQKELKLQKEQERRARIKAEEDARQTRLQQQEQERELKIKQDQIAREEAQRREDMERQEHQRQMELEARREAVRKELEDGVDTMYEEAMTLYKEGNYTAAADKFKDVQDILPGYRNAGQYMDEAREKALNPPPVVTPPPASSDSTSTMSRDESVSKALDLFDSNVK